jgi:hypothetical protein
VSTLLHATVYILFLHNLLNVLVQIANKMGFKKKCVCVCARARVRVRAILSLTLRYPHRMQVLENSANKDISL